MCSVVEIKNSSEYYIHYHSPESLESHQTEEPDSLRGVEKLFRRQDKESLIVSSTDEDEDIYAKSDEDMDAKSDEDIYEKLDKDIYEKLDVDIYVKPDEDIYSKSDEDINVRSDEDKDFSLGAISVEVAAPPDQEMPVAAERRRFRETGEEKKRSNEPGDERNTFNEPGDVRIRLPERNRFSEPVDEENIFNEQRSETNRFHKQKDEINRSNRDGHKTNLLHKQREEIYGYNKQVDMVNRYHKPINARNKFHEPSDQRNRFLNKVDGRNRLYEQVYERSIPNETDQEPANEIHRHREPDISLDQELPVARAAAEGCEEVDNEHNEISGHTAIREHIVVKSDTSREISRGNTFVTLKDVQMKLGKKPPEHSQPSAMRSLELTNINEDKTVSISEVEAKAVVLTTDSSTQVEENVEEEEVEEESEEDKLDLEDMSSEKGRMLEELETEVEQIKRIFRQSNGW